MLHYVTHVEIWDQSLFQMPITLPTEADIDNTTKTRYPSPSCLYTVLIALAVTRVTTKFLNFYFKPLNILKCLSFKLVFVRMDLNLA